MEHPPKRRKVERQVVHPSRHSVSGDGDRNIREVGKRAGNGPFVKPKRFLSSTGSPAIDLMEDCHEHDGSTVTQSQALTLKSSRLELRQLPSVPVANVADNADQPIVQSTANEVNPAIEPVVSPAAQAADNAVNAGQKAANNVVQPANNDVVQPAVDNAVQVVPPVAANTNTQSPPTQAWTPSSNPQAVNQPVANPPVVNVPPVNPPNVNVPTANPPPVSPPNVNVPTANPPPVNPPDVNVPPTNPPNVNSPPVNSPVTSPVDNHDYEVAPKPVDDEPGIVQPPAAEAAAAAREKALATQEANAEQASQSSPSSAGSVPPAPAAASNSASNVVGSPSPTAISIQIPGTSSQKPLSEPSTPLPPSPESTSSPSSYFPSSQQTTNLPSPSQHSNSAYNAHASSNSNLTTSSPSMTTASPSTMPISLSSISSVSQASAVSVSSMSVSEILHSSALAAWSRSSQSSAAAFATSSQPSTLMTMTLTSQISGQTPIQTSSSSSDVGGGIIGGTPTSSGAPEATPNSGSGSGGGNGTPPARVLVGGIIGGIAGVVLILLALLFLLRWRRGRVGQRRNISPPVAQMAGAGSAALGGAMTQRSSTRSTFPIAAAGIFGRLRPSSSQTATTSDTAPSERGFQKISGRKLPSVLQSGGDGYGDVPTVTAGASATPLAKPIAPGHGPFAGLAPGLRPPSPQRSLSGSSFYRDSHGFYGGVVPADFSTSEPTDPSSSPTSSSPTFPMPLSSGAPLAAAGRSPGRSSPGVPNIRPGPARQPVIQQGGVVPMRTPSRAQPPRDRPTPSPITEHPRDPLGRSHPSQDGSRQSRFKESTTPP